MRAGITHRLTWCLWGLGAAVGLKTGTAWLEITIGPLGLQFYATTSKKAEKWTRCTCGNNGGGDCDFCQEQEWEKANCTCGGYEHPYEPGQVVHEEGCPAVDHE